MSIDRDSVDEIAEKLDDDIRVVTELARRDVGIRELLRRAASDPGALPELGQKFATHVSGGRVEKLVNIASAHNVFILEAARAADAADVELLLSLPLVDGRLPRVQEVDFYSIGVSLSKYSDAQTAPYVRRDRADERLDEALRSSPFTLVVGPSKSGKSRTAFEAAKRNYPDAPLIVPSTSPGAIDQMFATEFPFDLGSGPAILWLDDLDHYLGGAGGLTLIALDRIARHDPKVIVLATMRSSSHETLAGSDGEVGRMGRLVLARAREERLDRRLTSEELAEARAVYADEEFDPNAGIGEQLVAAVELRRKYENGQESQPAGWSVVQAAVDWVRCGLHDPVSAERLRTLYDDYLRDLRPDIDATDEVFASGLEWARSPVAAKIALLRTAANGAAPAYLPFDYIVAYADGERGGPQAPIPAETWTCVMASAPEPDDLLRIALMAYQRGAETAAEAAATRAAESDDEDVTLAATLFLGEVAHERGEFEVAKEKYERVLDSRNEDLLSFAALDFAKAVLDIGTGVDQERAEDLLEGLLESDQAELVPLAQLNLAALRMNSGNLEGVEALLDSALESEHPDVVPIAQLNLGKLKADTGDFDGARKLLEAARASGPPAMVPAAHLNLGWVAFVEGDLAAAEPALQTALASGRREVVPLALLNLGAVRLNLGDLDEARRLLEEAKASGRPDVVPMAQLNLGRMQLIEGDLTGARQLSETALASGHPNVVPQAQLNLGWIHMLRGDAEAARPFLEQARASGRPDVLPLTELILGKLDADAGDLEGARVAFERMLATGRPEVVPLAQLNLGWVRLMSGDLEGARPLLEAALASGRPDVVPLAQLNVGKLEAEAGDIGAARALFEEALASERPDVVPLAQLNLGWLRMSEGDFEGALHLFEAALASARPEVVPLATLNVGVVRMQSGDVDAARALFEQALASGHREVVSQAELNLGKLSMDAGQLDEAEKLLESALASGRPDVVPMARLNLGALRFRAGDIDGGRRMMEEAIASGRADVVLMARLNLGLLELAEGDAEAARPLLEQSLESTNPEAVTVASFHLGVLAALSDETERARELLETATHSLDSELSARAAHLLGDLYMDAGDRDEAEARYRNAADANVEPWSGQALVALGHLLADRGATSEARETFERALSLGNSLALVGLAEMVAADEGQSGARSLFLDAAQSDVDEMAAAGHALLGEEYDKDGALDDARHAYEEAIARGTNTVWAAAAAAALGDLLGEEEPDSARDAYALAAESGHPAFAAQAYRGIARLQLTEGDRTGAIESLRTAVAFDDGEESPHAAIELGDVLASVGDDAGAQEAFRYALESDNEEARGTASERLEAH